MLSIQAYRSCSSSSFSSRSIRLIVPDSLLRCTFRNIKKRDKVKLVDKTGKEWKEEVF